MPVAGGAVQRRADRLQQRLRRSEDARRPHRISPLDLDRRHALERIGDRLPVAELEPELDCLLERTGRVVESVQVQVRLGQIEQRQDGALAVTELPSLGEALGGEPRGQVVVAFDERQVAEVVDRRRDDPAVSARAGQLERLPVEPLRLLEILVGDRDDTEAEHRPDHARGVAELTGACDALLEEALGVGVVVVLDREHGDAAKRLRPNRRQLIAIPAQRVVQPAPPFGEMPLNEPETG